MRRSFREKLRSSDKDPALRKDVGSKYSSTSSSSSSASSSSRRKPSFREAYHRGWERKRRHLFDFHYDPYQQNGTDRKTSLELVDLWKLAQKRKANRQAGYAASVSYGWTEVPILQSEEEDRIEEIDIERYRRRLPEQVNSSSAVEVQLKKENDYKLKQLQKKKQKKKKKNRKNSVQQNVPTATIERIVEPPIVKEYVKEAELNKIQPIIHRKRKTKEIRHSIQASAGLNRRETVIEDTKYMYVDTNIRLPDRVDVESTIVPTRAIGHAPIIESSTRVVTRTEVVTLPPIIEEEVRRTIIEHIHPVIIQSRAADEKEVVHELYESLQELPWQILNPSYTPIPCTSSTATSGSSISPAESATDVSSSASIDVEKEESAPEVSSGAEDEKEDSRSSQRTRTHRRKQHCATVGPDVLATWREMTGSGVLAEQLSLVVADIEALSKNRRRPSVVPPLPIRRVGELRPVIIEDVVTPRHAALELPPSSSRTSSTISTISTISTTPTPRHSVIKQFIPPTENKSTGVSSNIIPTSTFRNKDTNNHNHNHSTNNHSDNTKRKESSRQRKRREEVVLEDGKPLNGDDAAVAVFNELYSHHAIPTRKLGQQQAIDSDDLAAAQNQPTPKGRKKKRRLSIILANHNKQMKKQTTNKKIQKQNKKNKRNTYSITPSTSTSSDIQWQDSHGYVTVLASPLYSEANYVCANKLCDC